MTLITAVELGSNYPDNIMIEAAKQENGKFSSFCYLMRDGNIHKLMLSTQSIFDSKEDAENALHNLAQTCQQKYCK